MLENGSMEFLMEKEQSTNKMVDSSKESLKKAKLIVWMVSIFIRTEAITGVE